MTNESNKGQILFEHTRQVLRNVLFALMLVSYGFENLFLHFQEKIKYNDSKNVMWCNHQINVLNYFIYT